MPRFFFDCFDGQTHHVDEFGMTLRNDAEARDQAVALAQSLLTEDVPDQETRIVSVTVRATHGLPIYVAHCAFTACWTKDRPLMT